MNSRLSPSPRRYRSREGDIGCNPLVLGTAAIDTVELGDGVLHVTQRLLVEVIDLGEASMLLHRPLAERVFAEDQRTTIVLHGGSEDPEAEAL